MCMVDVDSCDWAFFLDKHPRARRDTCCDECGRTIAKGEQYRYATGKMEDYFQTMRMCAHCEKACRWLVVACGGYLFSAVYEDLAEHAVGDESYLRSQPLTRLVRWMRDDWRDRNGNLRPVDDVERVTSEAVAVYRQQYAESGAA